MNRTKIAYGEHPEQFGHLYLPDVPSADTLSVSVIVHGGSWSGDYALNMGTQYAVECARAGMAAWNIEYRRVGAGGTWPETSADVLAALQAVGTVVQAQSTVPLNTDDIRVLGHSAGGQLAVWLAGETDAPIRPSLVVAQAGVLDLVAGPEGGQPSPSVEALMGATYAEAPELYRSASPMHRGFTGVRVHCVHGDRDELVPLSHSTRYVDAATAAGDEAALTVVEGEGHFEFLQAGTGSWSASMAALLGPASE